MTSFTITIPPKAIENKADFLGLHPIPQVADPKWIDPEDGSSAPVVNEYTELEWLEEYTKRHLRKEYARGRHARRKDEIAYEENDTIVT